MSKRRKKKSYAESYSELEKELADYKDWFNRQENLLNEMRENGEHSFLNSPTYRQMKNKIEDQKMFLKNKDLTIERLRSSKAKADEELKQILLDNKNFIEHDGDTEYFVGITDNYHAAEEYTKLKKQNLVLESQIEGLKEDITERDSEIERLQRIIADLEYKQSTATVPAREVQELKKRFEEAVYNANAANFRAECEYKERSKIEIELNKRIEELELQLSEKPTTDNITDEELESLTMNDIRKKSSESIKGKADEDYKVTWFDYYDSMSRPEVLKRISYVETISDRRANKIKELKKELRNKRYDQYSEEDAITYNAALEKIDRLEHDLEMYQGFLENSNKREAELEQKVTELASATLSPEESIKVIEENIEQDKELKKANQKKQGRPVTVTDTQRAMIFELHKNGHSIRAIAKQVGKSVGTVHRILNGQ